MIRQLPGHAHSSGCRAQQPKRNKSARQKGSGNIHQYRAFSSRNTWSPWGREHQRSRRSDYERLRWRDGNKGRRRRPVPSGQPAQFELIRQRNGEDRSLLGKGRRDAMVCQHGYKGAWRTWEEFCAEARERWGSRLDLQERLRVEAQQRYQQIDEPVSLFG